MVKWIFRAALTGLSFALLSGCGKAGKKEVSGTPEMGTSANLQLIAEYLIDVKEPSGLSLAKDGQSLWTVSDDNGEVVQLDLEGKVLKRFQSGLRDLEGVTTLGHERLALLSEHSREVVITDLEGGVLKRAKFDLGSGRNKGPESVTFNETESVYYILRELSPGVLLTIDEDLQEVERRQLDFAKDYASMSYEPVRGHLWVMSEQSKAIYVLNMDLKIQTVFSMDIVQPEGMTVDYDRRRIWVVCDKTSKLYVFSFSDY